ncbi:MAG: GNAT family N-acetyltransferase [Gammaproteobacteria bacterium]|nr:GNAT family N-acetyltransferase [Gammaproteobacteria bacterium]
MPSEEYTIRTLGQISDIGAEAWDACANPGGGAADDPFISYAFLHAVEKSASAVPRTGWAPQHLVMETADGELVGAVPLYVKGHSQGEYIFDHSWADAFHRAGGEYYPKLLSAVPFTPVTGRRVLVKPGPTHENIEAHLLAAAIEVTKQLGVSSLHFNFLPEADWERMAGLGFLGRTDQQFHWANDGYSSFDDFLGELSSKKRKNLKRERRLALENDIDIEWVTGDALTERHWDAFYDFYMDTGARKWGQPYLTREFFSLISETMADRVLLILCQRGGRYVAGALNFIGSEALYGRNWGCLEDHPFLHFETCYYQAIDFAIAHGLKRVEAGAQGPHKLARGYLPTRTYSAHWIANEGLREAIDNYLKRERRYVDEEIEMIGEHSPFRVAASDDSSDG